MTLSSIQQTTPQFFRLSQFQLNVLETADYYTRKKKVCMLPLLFPFIHFFFRLTELGSFQNTLMKAINSGLIKNIKNLYGKHSFPYLVFFLSVRFNLILVFFSWRGISNISLFLGMKIQLHMVVMVTLYSSSVAYHTPHQTARTLLSKVGWLILDFPF